MKVVIIDNVRRVVKIFFATSIHERQDVQSISLVEMPVDK